MNPHPIDIAEAWHRERTNAPFHDVFLPHLHAGIVLLTPDHLFLSRRIHSTWDQERILDPSQTHPQGDTLHIWLAVGAPLRSWRSIIPSGIRFLSYHRGERHIIRPIQR